MNLFLEMLNRFNHDAIQTRPDQDSFNSAFQACSILLDYEQQLCLLDRMIDDGLHPTIHTFNIMIRCVRLFPYDRVVRACTLHLTMRIRCYLCSTCARVFQRDESYRKIKSLLGRLRAEGVEPNLGTYNLLLGVYWRLGYFEEALEFFHEMVRRECVLARNR